MYFDKYLTEAISLFETKTGRAWSGKINNIDKLLAWMYRQNILNKSEKKDKDLIFNAYYRYYNDGDIPKINIGKIPRKFRRFDDKFEIENALEETIENFIKRILTKYSGKYNRKTFRIDELIREYSEMSENLDDHYMSWYIKNSSKYPEEVKKILEISDEISEEIVEKEPSYKNKTINYVIDELKTENKDLYKKILPKYNEMLDLMDELNAKIKQYIRALKKYKEIEE